VCKEDYSKLDYFDVWMPEQLAPSAKLVSWALAEPFTPKRWSLFRTPPPARNASAGAAPYYYFADGTIAHAKFSIGCYAKARRVVIAPIYDSSFLSMAAV
jgi:hypothetical protein